MAAPPTDTNAISSEATAAGGNSNSNVGGLSHRCLVNHPPATNSDAILARQEPPDNTSKAQIPFFETPVVSCEPIYTHGEEESPTKHQLSRRGIDQQLKWEETLTVYQVESIKKPDYEGFILMPRKSSEAREDDGIKNLEDKPEHAPGDRRPKSIFPTEAKLTNDTAKAIARARRLRVSGGFTPEWQWPIVWSPRGEATTYIDGNEPLHKA